MDLLVTVILGLLTLAGAAAAMIMSPFLVMATDSANGKPRTAVLIAAYAVTWGGVAAGVLVAGAGVVRAAGRDDAMWIWPLVGIAVIAVCFGLGAWLATTSVPKDD